MPAHNPEAPSSPEYMSVEQAEALYEQGNRLFREGSIRFGGIGEGSYDARLANRVRYQTGDGELVTVTYAGSSVLRSIKLSLVTSVEAVTVAIEKPLPPTGAWPNAYLQDTFMLLESTITSPSEEERYEWFREITEYTDDGRLNDQDNQALQAELGGEGVEATLEDYERMTGQMTALTHRKLDELHRIYPDHVPSSVTERDPAHLRQQLQLLQRLTVRHEVGCGPSPYIRRD